ncbi:NUDIX domain-containing protein [Methylopila sp. M107]|uniref:NUDIX domain-containing protein n=1 Tax=Methylopila sp. M107 TaxID=1101190 RepID=UPI00035F9AD7|nr:NUDIX domain-containing protein [Methylopila sp. M107]
MTSLRARLFRAARARWTLSTKAMTLGVRALAQDKEGRVLLVRHAYTAGWHLPGGGVEIGETAEASAARELLEETNVTARGRGRLVGLYFNVAFGGRDHVALFRFDDFQTGPRPRPNSEIAEIGWFPLDALPEGATPATRRRLAEVFDGAESDGRW